MKVQCPTCEWGAELPEGLIPAAGSQMQCPQCGTGFSVSRDWQVTQTSPPNPEETPLKRGLLPQCRFEFVAIPAGEFMMGASPTEGDTTQDTKPRHRVALSRGFEIQAYPVTQALWEAVMGSNPSKNVGPDRPVELVSFKDVEKFLKRLNKRGDGYRYRLPTEAEWEYSARAACEDARYGEIDEILWCWENAGMETHPVGEKKSNAWGLYDVLGNVWEWCQDWYDEFYYASSPELDPTGPDKGVERVIRGGSFVTNGSWMSFSFRKFDLPDKSFPDLGFRCVREAEPTEK